MAGLTGLAALGCASGLPVRPPEGVASAAGTWHGRMVGPFGHATARLVVAGDGTFRGTRYFVGNDQEFSGSLASVWAGALRFQSTDGVGSVTLAERDGRQVLRFVPDGGGGLGEFTRSP
jgi:hypothetical protein